MIHSVPSFGEYSKFEIRCKVPNQDGLWPAFWTFGGCNEIDIFEFFSDPSTPETALHKWPGDDPKMGKKHGDGTDYSPSFHTYSVEYEEFTTKFFIDDILVWYVPRLLKPPQNFLDLWSIYIGNCELECNQGPGAYHTNLVYP